MAMPPSFLDKIPYHTKYIGTLTLSACACDDRCLTLKWLLYLVKRVVILHDVDQVIARDRFHNLDFLNSK